jgi:CheY-like chemotaxis protein
MSRFNRFLVVDDLPENRFLISKALLKEFPDALVAECQDSSTAIAVVSRESCSIVIVHRTRDLDGATFTDVLRRYCPRVPVLLLSEDAVEESALTPAGGVVSWNSWKTIGRVCADIIAQNQSHWANAKRDTDYA